MIRCPNTNLHGTEQEKGFEDAESAQGMLVQKLELHDSVGVGKRRLLLAHSDMLEWNAKLVKGLLTQDNNTAFGDQAVSISHITKLKLAAQIQISMELNRQKIPPSRSVFQAVVKLFPIRLRKCTKLHLYMERTD